MITRLEVDGFKSLRDFTIDLEPFTVLVGPNSAGKSNILEALALLSRLASEPIEAAFKHGRGRAIDQFTRESSEQVTAIRFAVGFLVPAGALTRYPESLSLRYELTIARERQGSGADTLVVHHEQLATADGQRIFFRQVEPSRKERNKEARVVRGDFEDRQEHRVPPALTHLAAACGGALGMFAVSDSVESAAGAVLAGTRLVHLDTARLQGESDRIGSAVLAPDASNLPTVLASLPPHTLGEIRADLVALVPGISTFESVPDNDTFRIEFELSGGDHLPARLVSDGTLRALALLTALRAPPTPPAIAIEEPENGIYPGRLRTLIDLLRETAEEGAHGETPPQILLTSHSPVVLAEMRPTPERLRFISVVRRGGHLVTRARRVGDPTHEERGMVVPLTEVDGLLSLARSEAP